MKSSKHDWTLSAKSFQLMNFSEAMFYENYLTPDFHTNTVISSRVCLLVKNRDKLRPISVTTGWHEKRGEPPKIVRLFRKISVRSARTIYISTFNSFVLSD